MQIDGSSVMSTKSGRWVSALTVLSSISVRAPHSLAKSSASVAANAENAPDCRLARLALLLMNSVVSEERPLSALAVIVRSSLPKIRRMSRFGNPTKVSSAMESIPFCCS